MISDALKLFKFHCPYCRTKISAEAELAGLAASCPVCQQGFVVPEEGEGMSSVVLPMPMPPAQASRSQAPAASRIKRVHVFALVAMMLSLLAAANYSFPDLMPWYAATPEPAAPPMLSAKQFAAQEAQKAIHSADGKPCGQCKGTGLVGKSCPLCIGRGTIQTASGYIVVCPDCRGTGSVPGPCPGCKGTGVFHVQ